MVRKVFLAFTLVMLSGVAQGYTVLIWGDSLSSAYDIPEEKGWVSLLQNRVADLGVEVVNGSIPGEISHSGSERIAGALETIQPDLVVIGLGSNDGLQGKKTSELKLNLQSMIATSRQSGAEVVLLGMRIPPNYGKDYAEQFHRVFLDLADENETGLVPFFLEPVALDYDLFLADGVHPNEKAQPMLLDHVWPALEPYLPE